MADNPGFHKCVEDSASLGRFIKPADRCGVDWGRLVSAFRSEANHSQQHLPGQFLILRRPCCHKRLRPFHSARDGFGVEIQ